MVDHKKHQDKHKDKRKDKIGELLQSFQVLRQNLTSSFKNKNKNKNNNKSNKESAMLRITPAQWGAIMIIEKRGASSIKDIAKSLGITSSAATQLIDGLVESKYVLRQEHAQDRRAVSLILTKKTKLQVQKMKAQAFNKFLKIFEVLNDKEFEQYCAIMRKITYKL